MQISPFLFVLLAIHGIGHMLGVVASFRKSSSNNWNTDSWILDQWTTADIRRSTAACLFIFAALASITAALSTRGWIFEVYEWRTLAIVSAWTSLISIILFPNSLYNIFNRTAAILLNIAIIVALFLLPNLSITL